MVRQGKRTIQAELHDHTHHHGIHHARSGRPGGSPMPRFATYWWSTARHSLSPEDLLVDPIALTQIWPRLAAKHRDALLALATHDDYEAAATALNKTIGRFRVLICEGRKEFFRLWHQGETPSRMWGSDIRKRKHPNRSHHSVTFVTIRRRKRRREKKEAGA